MSLEDAARASLTWRAHFEDRALSEEFGEECEADRRRVPGWIQRLRHWGQNGT